MSENKQQGISFGILIIAVIIGSGIVKQFDSENLTFEKPALAVVYLIAFLVCIYFLAQGFKKNKEDS